METAGEEPNSPSRFSMEKKLDGKMAHYSAPSAFSRLPNEIVEQYDTLLAILITKLP